MTAARVVSDQTILNGKPVIAGTRISVELIREKLGAGESADDILAAPSCTAARPSPPRRVGPKQFEEWGG
jgi:uncharacterized protein (DUF433 family)